MSPIRVLVVDDSPICRELLRDVLEADGDIAVVGEAESGPQLLGRVRGVRPDLVTMDLRMPGMDGLEAIARLMAEEPRPVLVVTEVPSGPGEPTVFEATRRGALDVMCKPPMGDAVAARELRARVRVLARVPVVRHPAASIPAPPPAPARSTSPLAIIGVGASVGGPAALARLLRDLPERRTPAIAVVQHIPSGFAAAFARFLADRTALRIVIASSAVAVERGLVVVPPDDRHLVARGDVLEPAEGPPGAGLRPSVDVLFRSIASAHGARAMGVILTGIGRDGAEGLAALRAAGADTIAEAESTATVWGMPRAAVELGAATRTLPLPEIARVIEARCGGPGVAR